MDAQPKCPHCGNILSKIEIKENECWTCENPLIKPHDKTRYVNQDLSQHRRGMIINTTSLKPDLR